MPKDDLIRPLEGLPIPAIRYFDSIGSTNDAALRWAEAGAADGSLVVADQQTSGRGRLGRSWVTNPGAALAFSMVLRPSDDEMGRLELFSRWRGWRFAARCRRWGCRRKSNGQTMCCSLGGRPAGFWQNQPGTAAG